MTLSHSWWPSAAAECFPHLPAERTRRRNHDRPEPPDGGGAGGDHDGAEEGRRAEEGRGGEDQVETCDILDTPHEQKTFWPTFK